MNELSLPIKFSLHHLLVTVFRRIFRILMSTLFTVLMRVNYDQYIFVKF